jgi:dipeptidyl aminopeptidase/acylaminoacyl peptidase
MTALRRWLWAAAAAVALLSVPGLPAGAQTRRPMTLVDIAELQRLLAPRLSPDGRTLAYMLTKADWKAGRAIAHLWRQDVNGTPVQLTFSEGGDVPAPRSVRWAPDGKAILFLRAGQIQLIPADGGEPRALTRHATPPSSPMWSPDGTTVYFLASDPPTSEERERDRLRDDVYAFEENYKPQQLWKVSVATGAEQQLTTGETSVLEYRLSRDGSKVAMQRGPTPLVGDGFRGEVWVMDVTGANARALTRNEIQESAAELSPDNSQVLFLADTNERFEPYYNTAIFVVPAAGGTPQPLLPDFKYAIDDAAWAPDGKSIIAVANLGVHSELVQIDVASHRARQLTDGRHFIPTMAGGWQIVPGTGTIMMQLDQPARWGDVWTMPLTGGTPTQVTHVYDPLERDFILPRQEKVEWKGADGHTIEGILMYPLGYQQGTRYPLVVQMHGGPFESDHFGGGSGQTLNYFAVLAAKGYAVLRPNYRGSTGYGNAFYRDPVGNYFRNMATDVMNGVDALIAQGIADPDRLVCMGWSAGGTLVNKLVTMTDRFKAASSGAGIANWISLFAQSEIRSYRVPWFGGTPWQKNAPIDLLWNSSPLKDVANVKTPTLFISGDGDTRVGLPQSVEMYRALKSHHVPTHLLVGPGEGHVWGGLRHQIEKANRELEWFEKYANRRSYKYEKAPTP